MSYVSIWKPVHEEIVKASRNVHNEIIGLLLGRLESDTIIIEDSATGEFETEKHRATLTSTTLAKIADDVVNQRVKGSIIGWYHSHTEGGLFLSDTDIQTQKNLQQFSSLVTAMVVDCSTGEVGYFRVDTRTGRQVRIPGNNVIVYEDPTEAVPPDRARKARVRPTPTIEARQLPPQPKASMQKLVIAILLIAIVASAAVLGILFLRREAPGPVAIIHTPILSATVGTPIAVKANVTATVRSVSLLYALAGSGEFTEAEMNSQSPSEYEYTIPGEKVTNSIEYYVKTVDSLGDQHQTATYMISVADFAISTISQTVTVYRNSSASSTLSLLYINGFNYPISLSTTGAPQGVTVVLNPNPVPSGTTQAMMNIVADGNAANGAFSMLVTGIYTPPQGPRVSRQTTFQVIVTDFDLQVSPSSRTVSIGSTATYTVTLTIAQGFIDPVQVTVQGLPQGASYELVTSGTSVMVGGMGTTTLTLHIVTTSLIKSGSYALTVTAAGGGLIHRLTIQLIVR